MVLVHDLGIPAHGDKDGVDAAGQRRGEDVCDLEANEEGKGHDDGGGSAVAKVVVEIARVAAAEDAGLEEEVRDEAADDADEEGAEAEDGTDEAFLYKLERGRGRRGGKEGRG